MKIAVAQIKPISGSIAENIGLHKKMIDMAVLHGADALFSPNFRLQVKQKKYFPIPYRLISEQLEDPFLFSSAESLKKRYIFYRAAGCLHR